MSNNHSLNSIIIPLGLTSCSLFLFSSTMLQINKMYSYTLYKDLGKSLNLLNGYVIGLYLFTISYNIRKIINLR